MTTPAYRSLIDDMIEDAERRHTVKSMPGQSLPDALGLPPETLMINTPICSAMTIKRGRRVLEVMHGN